MEKTRLTNLRRVTTRVTTKEGHSLVRMKTPLIQMYCVIQLPRMYNHILGTAMLGSTYANVTGSVWCNDIHTVNTGLSYLMLRKTRFWPRCLVQELEILAEVEHAVWFKGKSVFYEKNLLSETTGLQYRTLPPVGACRTPCTKLPVKGIQSLPWETKREHLKYAHSCRAKQSSQKHNHT